MHFLAQYQRIKEMRILTLRATEAVQGGRCGWIGLRLFFLSTFLQRSVAFKFDLVVRGY